MKKGWIAVLLVLAAVVAVWRGETWVRDARWRRPYDAGCKALGALRFRRGGTPVSDGS